ncbi:uncharacterized protein LOC116620823 [Nematostella vectensis]|uniref:uncharacterized protein LOC116620823 n=1 Tax=Nematostella vectensis TaxID=45351 RepID=UPI002076D64C|nr:uncharacterized protein LOC116620823 [Nematostella vectensis]
MTEEHQNIDKHCVTNMSTENRLAYPKLFKCTLYCDLNLINHRNVKSDVSSAANPCRRFFQLEARIIAAALQLLGKCEMDEQPTQNVLEGGTDATKQEDYFRKLAALVVHTLSLTRYPCRFLGCSKSFAHDGKIRREHEASHNPPLVISYLNDAHVFDTMESKENKEGDDMLAYQTSLIA